jgi:Tol biopolymer transport system component
MHLNDWTTDRRPLIVLAALLLSLRSVAGPPTDLLTWHGHRMFEDFSARTEVSPDGQWVLRTFVDGDQALLKLPSGERNDAKLQGDVKNFERAAWCGNDLLRVGAKGTSRAWFAGGSSGTQTIAVPPDATPVCNGVGDELAHYTSYPARRELPPPKVLFLGNRQQQQEIALGAVVMNAKFSHDGKVLYAIARQDDGASSLFSISVATHAVTRLAQNLDAWPFPGSGLAVTADDAGIILPLATLHAPDDAERQKPVVPERWLKLYRFDIAKRQFSLVSAVSRSDEVDPVVVNSDLFWVTGHTKKNVLALPISGGAAHTVVTDREEAYLPTWSRDGKRLAFVVGEYRLADWALTQDVGIVPIDEQVRATGPSTMFVVGNHEDFPVDWSRDGRWIAWHSHRAPHNPPYYDAPGTTDDIWVRRAEDLDAPEIRATHDLWETGWAYWSPDGRELLYSTWDRNGAPGLYELRVTRFDPVAGRTLGERRFPMPKAVHSPEVAIWSPSGAEIAVEDAVSPQQRTLWIVSKDGSHLSKVATYPSETYGGVDWTPDGQRLIFSGLDGGRMQIYSVSRGGGTPQRLSDGKGSYLNPRVSPDGKWIACSEIETTQTLHREHLQ